MPHVSGSLSIPPEGAICDFCSSPDVHWSFPCPDFSIHRDLHATGIRADLSRVEQDVSLDWGSGGGWAACPVCAELVKRDDRERLLRRSAKTLIKRRRVPISMRNAMDLIRPLHEKFFAHRYGEPIYHEHRPKEDPTR